MDVKSKNIVLANEPENRRKGMIISGIIHALILLLFFIPFVTRPEIIDAGGILIAFGEPDAGSADNEEQVKEMEESQPQPSSSVKSSAAESQDFKAVEEEAPVKAKVDPKKTPAVTPKPTPAKTAAQIAAEEQKKKEAEEKARAEQEAAEKAKRESQKKKYSDLLGKGKGNNNNAGNQGDPNGSPDSKELDKITKGSGRVGGGLSGRGVEYEPSFADNSQKTGKVTLTICVSKDGKVQTADFTQKGSTTSDPYLIGIAQKTALKYRFSKSEIESQCGTMTIDFRLQ